MKAYPKTKTLLASMKPGEHRKIASNRTLVVTKDGSSAYVLTNNDYAYPYLGTDANEWARVEDLLEEGTK